MRPQLPEHAVVVLLRQCFITPRCQVPRYRQSFIPRSSRSLYTARRLGPSTNGFQQRLFQSSSCRDDSSQSKAPAKFPAKCQSRLPLGTAYQDPSITNKTPGSNIAVIGGGITGLSSAYYLTREFPDANITIYESAARLGGWVDSTIHEINGEPVVLEQGPRSLRPHTPAGLVTLGLIKDLNLESELLITPKGSIAARNRFIYYPDHLVKLPGPGQSFYDIMWSIITEPAFKGWGSALFEAFGDSRNESIKDESVGAFLERRLGGPELVNNIASAGLHGIYAGDIYQLSAKSLMPTLWMQEIAEGSIALGLLKASVTKGKAVLKSDHELQFEMEVELGGGKDQDGSWFQLFSDTSVYTFKTGIGALTNALANNLIANPKVFWEGAGASNVEYDSKSEAMKVTSSKSKEPKSYAHTISTIPGAKLANISSNQPSLASIHSVTVMVVNLFYSTPHLIPEPGFGYLIPNSIPLEQNPECALGVVYDTYSSIGQDGPGTKLTVMLGGHWWDAFDEYPDEEEGVAMARAIVARHLGITDLPAGTQAKLHRECIPQYTVGHDARMTDAHNELLEEFDGHLSVAGSSYDGVGLNDCVRGARDVVMKLKRSPFSLSGTSLTGLENFSRGREWIEVSEAQQVGDVQEWLQEQTRASEEARREAEDLVKGLEESQKRGKGKKVKK